jgi:hypothetical protein
MFHARGLLDAISYGLQLDLLGGRWFSCSFQVTCPLLLNPTKARGKVLRLGGNLRPHYSEQPGTFPIIFEKFNFGLGLEDRMVNRLFHFYLFNEGCCFPVVIPLAYASVVLVSLLPCGSRHPCCIRPGSLSFLGGYGLERRLQYPRLD